MPLALFVQTNDADKNEVIAFSRADDGALGWSGRYPTGGRGTGEPYLASAGSVVLSEDGRWLLVVNAGSDDVSLFAVQPDGLRLANCAGSGGSTPTSVAVSGALVYVLNNGTPGTPTATGTLHATDVDNPATFVAQTNAAETYGKFSCEPLERGYGITLGNSLRRILLSSLQGAAITAVKLEGALHEFTTIGDVVEDVTDIILNLKEVVLKAAQAKVLPLNNYPSTLDPAEITKVLTLMKSGGLATGSATASSLLLK